MKCPNCRCVVPDTCEYCMYCGHPMPPNGSTKTIPIQEYTNNVTHYHNVADMPQAKTASHTEYNPYVHRQYYNNGYNGAYRDPGYYNNYDQNGNYYGNNYSHGYYYDNRGIQYPPYRHYEHPQKDESSKFGKLVLLLIAADAMFLISLLVVFLLFKV